MVQRMRIKLKSFNDCLWGQSVTDGHGVMRL
jgi:hypothetical protein